MDHSNHSVCLIDNGLFVSLAETLGKSFGKAYYYSPIIWGSDPKSNLARIGRGLPGVERVDAWEPLVGEVDLWVFPDVYNGPLQVLMEQKLGQRVWGSRMGEELELYREDAKRHMKSLGIPIGAWQSVHGIDALREYLKTHKDQRVKRSFFRADMATFQSEEYSLVEPHLDELQYEAGPARNDMEFICEDSIPDAVEIGGDCYTIDGQWPKEGMWGIEVKSKCYVGRFTAYDKWPSQITECHRVLEDSLKRWRYRNWLSLEKRVTKDGTPWVIDPCARWGNPPGALCQWMYTNLPDILMEGADGKCIDPVKADEWGCQIQMYSSWSAKNKLPVDYPDDIADHVKLVNATMMDGRRWIIPTADESTSVGSVVASGKTMKEAIEKATEIAKEVRAYDLNIETDACKEAQEQVEKMAEYGIRM